jgi:hypothetical protein
MINTTFVGQAHGDTRRKLQKLEGMNSSQLLEVATMVFVNWDQEVQKEAEWKIKKKVDLLAAVLNRWWGHSSSRDRGWVRGKGGPPGNPQQAWPQESELLKKNQPGPKDQKS